MLLENGHEKPKMLILSVGIILFQPPTRVTSITAHLSAATIHNPSRLFAPNSNINQPIGKT